MITHWPYDRPEGERQAIAAGLERCETPAQAQEFLGAALLGSIICDILMAPPVWREHWWQWWRPRHV